jgi:signal transduction histidine kinase
MKARLTLWFFVSVVLGLVCMHATAQDLITERAIFEDRSGDLTFEQVQKARFAKADKVVSRGYTRAAVWVRLTIDSPGDARTLVLRVAPATLDEVTLFSPPASSAGPAANVNLGRRLPDRSSLVDAKPGKNIYYLRVKTTGTLMLSPSILTADQAQQEDITRGIVLGAVLACCIPLMIAVLVLIVLRRELLHVLFFLTFCVSVAVFFAWFGYLRAFFGPDSWVASTATVNYLAVANVFTGFLFFRVLFGRFGLPRWGRNLFGLFFVLYVPLFVLFFLLDRQSVLMWSSMLGMMACAFCLPLTVVVFYRHRPATWFIGTIVLLALLLLLRSFFTLQGIVAADASTMNLLAYRVFLLAGFFISILVLIDRDKKSLLQTSILNETVARRLAESEKNRREIQERFMTMLMHELKTPLAIIQLAATSLGRHLVPGSGDATRVATINRSVDDLNVVIERCVLADQIEQGAAHINKQRFALKALTDDLLETVGADRVRLVGPQDATVVSDYQYVRLILLNLLSNALKYSSPDSLVEFEIQNTVVKDVPVVYFSVSNAVGAAGMPDPAQVFARYYRAESAREHVGAGLGLWLAQAVARQLGSEVHFRAAQGRVVFGFGLELA